MKYLIGVDGGGTKTLGYIGNDEGLVLAKAYGGPCNYHSVGIDSVKYTLSNLINLLCSAANIGSKEIKLLSLGLAGVDRPYDRRIIEEAIWEIDIKGNLIINNDGKTSLVGALGKEEGVITVCGTGSISLGIDRDKKLVRAGGWGHIIGDEGSGYDFGVKGLNAVMRYYDGRGKKTTLKDKILKRLNLTSCEEIIGYVYDKTRMKTDLAKLAPLVFEGAEEGDEIALQIVDGGIKGLGEMTETVIRQLNFRENKTVLSIDGGILRNVSLVRDRFMDEMRRRIKDIEIVYPIFDGAVGALILGWNKLEVKYSIEDLKQQMKGVKAYG